MRTSRSCFTPAFAAALVLSTPVLGHQQEIAIWPGKAAPGSETWTHQEVHYTYPSPAMKMVRNVVTPTLTVYAPNRENANGTAVIVAPGGGMRFLSWENEGTAVAEWLAARGVTAFVLKYRLMKTPAEPKEFDKAMKIFFAELKKAAEARPGEITIRNNKETMAARSLAFADGRQAVKYVRAHAAQWGIEPNRIGLMGFSAGAYVTMDVAINHDTDSRPDFAAPIYGGRMDSRSIPTDGPPLFIIVAQNDRWTFDDSQRLYRDWSAAGLPVDFHSFAQGGHGFGMAKQNLPVDHWIDLYGYWLDGLGLLKRGDTPHKSSLGAPTSEAGNSR